MLSSNRGHIGRVAGSLFVRGLLLIAFLATAGAGCAGPTAQVRHEPQRGEPPRHERAIRTEYGIASWYGRKFHGRSTASGERFDMYEYTAAHRTLPFGTYVRVTNLRNGRHAVVRINDRGPFVRGRKIDLSYVAAKDIGMLETGLEEVRIEVLAG